MNENSFMRAGESPVFKGCTRPACFFGVPIQPLIVVVGVIFLLAFWTGIIPILLLAIPAILIMRAITKHDDQTFNQMGVKARTRRQNVNHKFWNACSYQACSYKKPKPIKAKQAKQKGIRK